MAKISEHEITLDLDGSRVTIKQLAEASKDLLGLLEAVDRKVMKRGRASLEWVISGMDGGSAHLTIAPQPTNAETVPLLAGPRVVRAVADGLSELAEGRRPAQFDDRALNYARRLAKYTQQRGIDAVRVQANGVPRTLGNRERSLITELLGQGEWVIGSVEGKLKMMSIHGRNSFKIYEIGTDHAVECFFPDHLLAEVHGAFTRRVSAFGRMQLSPSGKKKRLHVRKLLVFPPDSELPNVRDVTGILKNG